MDIEGAEEMVAGLIQGLIQKDDLPDLQKCMKNAESLEVELTGVIADLEKGDLQDIIKAAQEVGQIIKEVPVDLADCKDIQGDLTKIENWGKQLANPVTLAESLTKNIIANWGPVQADIGALTKDYSASQYFKAGGDIADVTILALGKISEAKKQKELFDIEQIKNFNLF